MNTTLKIAGVAAWFFGQSLVLPAQTAWYNPVADSLLPVQGRAWNAETGKVYRPHRTDKSNGSPYANGWEILDQITLILFK